VIIKRRVIQQLFLKLIVFILGSLYRTILLRFVLVFKFGVICLFFAFSSKIAESFQPIFYYLSRNEIQVVYSSTIFDEVNLVFFGSFQIIFDGFSPNDC